MKLAFCGIASVCLLCAQDRSTYTNLTRDANGNLVEGSSISQLKTKTGVERTERLESINGRLVRREKVEERVIREDASGKTVERIVLHFDPNGNPGPPEKTLIEEQKQGDNVTVRTTTYRGDLSGNMQLAERSLAEKHKNTTSEKTEMVVERPTINGSLETVEKRTVERTNAGTGTYQENTTTYRLGESGLYLAQKLVTSHDEKNGQRTDNTAEYEVGSSGTLELHSQMVTNTSKKADGSEVIEVDQYSASVPGTVGAAGSKLKLKEREVVDRKKGSGGTVETVSVRHPSVSDPGVLGPARVIAERVCRGKCE